MKSKKIVLMAVSMICLLAITATVSATAAQENEAPVGNNVLVEQGTPSTLNLFGNYITPYPGYLPSESVPVY